MKGIVVAIIVICMIGCGKKNSIESGILDREKMVAVMWDFIGADVFTEKFIKKDSAKNALMENMQLQNKIFSIHKISRDNFYKSYDYYISNTDMMRSILDSMTAKAERDRTKMIQYQNTRPQY